LTAPTAGVTAKKTDKMPVVGGLADQGSRFDFARPHGGGLFDFQCAAVAFCVERLQSGQDAVLALDTGLGKTVVLRGILQALRNAKPPFHASDGVASDAAASVGAPTPGARADGDVEYLAVVLSPGGLVRQTATALRSFPWEKPSVTEGSGRGREAAACVVAAARDGDLTVALAEKSADYAVSAAHIHDVLVQNRAIGRPADQTYRYTVVDEAHQLQVAVLRRLKGPVLFVTACVLDCQKISDTRFRRVGTRRTPLQGREFGSSCFVVSKTERVSRLLGLSSCRLLPLPASLPAWYPYLERLLTNVRYPSSHGDVSKAQALLALPPLLGHGNTGSALAVAAACGDSLHALLQRVSGNNAILRERTQVCQLAGAVFRYCQTYVAEDERGRFLLPMRRACEAVSLARAVVVEEEGRLPRPSACPCCGLTESELALLYHAHICALPPLVAPWSLGPSSGGGSAAFWSALVRFPTKGEIRRTLALEPPPSDVDVHVLTSDMSAGKRAKTIRDFCGYGGSRAAIVALRRGVLATGTALNLRKLGRIGCGRFFVNEIAGYLARRRVLLADAVADVGFNLHRHTDALVVPKVVATRAELQQLLGRLTRIDVDVASQGVVDVVTTTHKGTLDSLFARHVAQEEARADTRSDEGATTRGPAARIRSLLAEEPELLHYFENALTIANT
jgi:hypothetical protein